MDVHDADDVKDDKAGGIGETISVVVQALLIALVFRTFLFQPFSIPTGSMTPTLLIGDYLLVSKFSYGYSRYSIPFSPDLFEGRIGADLLGGEPERGDIAVFRLPRDPRLDYIKRVVGLPGDTVQMREGQLYLNDVAVPRERAGTYVATNTFGEPVEVPIFLETLPNGVSYRTLDADPSGPGDDTAEFVVPEGHYFMMGDNRDNSADSRFTVGMVPLENFVGRAQIIFFSIGEGASALEVWKWPTALRPGRIFELTE